MITCICNNISDKKFAEIIQDNSVKSINDIRKCGVEFQCCKCAPEVKQLIKEQNEKD